MPIDNDKLIKALSKLSAEEIQETLRNKEKLDAFKQSCDDGKPDPSIRWRESQKHLVSFLERCFPEEAKWWDGWNVEYQFDYQDENDILHVTLRRVEGEQKIISLFITDIPF